MISDLIFLLSLTLINKLKNDLIQLENSSTLRQFEKELMTERIKGLYEALQSLIGSFSISYKIEEEYKSLFMSCREILESHKILNESFANVLDERNNLLEDYSDLYSVKNELETQKDKIMKNFKGQYSALQSELSKTIEERESLKDKNLDLEKKFSDLSEELKKLRTKLKQKPAFLDLEVEKFCSKCQKTYFEHENFNWSCRTHQNQYSGNMY